MSATAQAPERGRIRLPDWGLLLLASPAFPLGLVAMAIFVVFAADEGGFHGTTFLPATIVLLGALGVGLLVLPRPRPPKAVLVAALLLAGYAAFSYLSILWAGQKGVAWDGANRTLLYAVIFAVFALWPMRAGPAAFLLGLFCLGVAGVGLVEMLRVENASQSIQFFHEGRLSEPLGYGNANVALWTSALWPSMILAGRKEVPPLVRGLLLGASGLLAALAVLGQSRGWLLSLPIVALLAIVAVPGRGRTIAALAAVAVGILAIRAPLLDVYESFDAKGPPGPEYSSAVDKILIVSLVLAAVGLAWGLLEKRVRVGEITARRVSAALVVVVVLAGAGASAAVVARADDPLGTISDKWKEFKKGEGEPSFEGNRLASASFSSYRSDAWSVAWGNFTRHPIGGVGADNFLQDYLLRGKSDQTPSYPHSLEFRTLSQTGIVGTLLLAGAIVAALLAAMPVLRRGGGLAGATAGAALMLFAYWVVHGSADWLWEFPGLGGPAFAALGIACAVGASRFPTLGVKLPGGRAALAVGGLAAFVCVVGLALPWLAERNLRGAREIATTDPQGALDRLDRASRLNTLSPLANQTAGYVQVRQGRSDLGELEFREALERDPRDSFSYLMLAAIASSTERSGEARRLIDRANELAPRDRVVGPVRRALLRGRRVTPERVRELILEDIDLRIGPS